ncbi:MAG TPA: M48 family metallopeptidase [Chitinophagales bacterium]|nr:M48 family metallopeptidase [Chitinophagales bacterium]
MAQVILYFIVAFIAFEFALSKTLSWLNLKTWDKPLPDDVKDLYDQEKYVRAKEYAVANYNVGTVTGIISFVITITFLLLHGFAWVDAIARSISPSPILQCLIFFAIIGAASSVISLPFDIYDTFVIEQKFGFNRTTPRTFVFDKLKGLVLAVVLGGGILALLTWLYTLLGNYFWLAAWGVISGISIFLAMFYTSIFLPLFNKLTPLAEGELRSSLEKYAAKVGFPLTNIFVMDGSKRSTKANAFFSGLGHKKNIVLYDNLVNDMNTDEITAVLAHEVGHYKKKHVLQSMVISVAQMGIMLFIFGWLAGHPIMAQVLGAKQNSFHLSLITFGLLYSPISMVTGLLMNLFSRKNEYEADAYAKQTYSAAPLITALKKLSVNHLSNLQPHPAFVFFNYSHPTLLQRMRAME